LQTLGVTHVVSCLGPSSAFHAERGVQYKVLELRDAPDQHMLPHFDAVYDWISAAAAGNGRVLVHCAAGVSRSATLVAAYLMRHGHCSAGEALRRVQELRSCANPNEGFRQQLLYYEEELQRRARAAAGRVSDGGVGEGAVDVAVAGTPTRGSDAPTQPSPAAAAKPAPAAIAAPAPADAAEAPAP
jgi:predicted protein tyrosine phosphatase